jgi:hypothetical protein
MRNFIPTLEYTAEDADRARSDARHVVRVCAQLLNPAE